MMHKLSNQELVLELKNLIQIERQTVQKVIEYLQEVERRQLYLEKGYSSLFVFCTEELGYSESSAQRRISAMRLSKEIPEIKEKLTQGSLNLSTVSMLQTAVKRQEKQTHQKLPTIVKLELLEKIENKSQRETEKELALHLPDSTGIEEKVRPINSEEYELRYSISNNLHNKLQRLRELLTHRNSNPTQAELLEILADMALKQLDPLQKKTSDKPVPKSTAAAVVQTRHIPQTVRTKIWNRDQGMCTFQDHQTGKKCNSRFGLELDHKFPWSLGGEHSEKNLRLLCKQHNAFAWQEVSRMCDANRS